MSTRPPESSEPKKYEDNILHIHIMLSIMPTIHAGFMGSVHTMIVIKVKIHSSCEIKYFVETHLYKLCVILRSRVLRVVYLCKKLSSLFLGRCSPAAECFFSHFWPRGKLACHEYIMKQVWISVERRGGARRIKRRLAGSILQGIAFRLPETSRSLGTPQIVFQNLIF